MDARNPKDAPSEKMRTVSQGYWVGEIMGWWRDDDAFLTFNATFLKAREIIINPEHLFTSKNSKFQQYCGSVPKLQNIRNPNQIPSTPIPWMLYLCHVVPTRRLK